MFHHFARFKSFSRLTRSRVCRQAQRFQKLVAEDFTRRNRSHSVLLMIVHDFALMRTVIFPSKTDPPLVIGAFGGGVSDVQLAFTKRSFIKPM
jgi:hypothetical protein